MARSQPLRLAYSVFLLLALGLFVVPAWAQEPPGKLTTKGRSGSSCLPGQEC
jgi:hypothetical protein